MAEEDQGGAGELELPQTSRTWYVVFTPPLSKSWWYKLTGKKFSHCFCYCQDGPDVIVFDRLYSLHFTVYRNTSCDVVAEAYRNQFKGFRILKVTTTQPQTMRYFGILTCVSHVKFALGISSWSILPKQLYRTLLKHYNATKAT